MKIRELLNEFRRSPLDGENERSSDSVNEAFIAGSEQAPSRGFPSQQDGPRH